MPKKTIFLTGALIATTLLPIGCASEEEAPAIVQISPADGETTVSRAISVVVTFRSEMDISSCEQRFGLHQGEHMSVIGGMMHMADRAPGTFQWNDSQTMMTFTPDSLLADSSMHSICLAEGMMSQSGMMMGMDGMMGMGGMMGMDGMMGTGMQAGQGLISHFTTE